MSPDNKRDDILLQAALLFADKGFHKTSLNDIARATGIQKPTLYHYFAGKEEILYHVEESVLDALLDRHAARHGEGEDPEPLECLRRCVHDLLTLSVTHRGNVRVFLEYSDELSPPYSEVIREKWDRYVAILNDHITEAAKEGTAREVNVLALRMLMLGACTWAYQWFDPSGPLGPSDLGDLFWDVLMNGILPR